MFSANVKRFDIQPNDSAVLFGFPIIWELINYDPSHVTLTLYPHAQIEECGLPARTKYIYWGEPERAPHNGTSLCEWDIICMVRQSHSLYMLFWLILANCKFMLVRLHVHKACIAHHRLISMNTEPHINQRGLRLQWRQEWDKLDNCNRSWESAQLEGTVGQVTRQLWLSWFTCVCVNTSCSLHNLWLFESHTCMLKFDWACSAQAPPNQALHDTS